MESVHHAHEAPFENLNLLDFGNKILLGGAVYSGNGVNYVCLFPDDATLEDEFNILNLTSEDWKKVIRQSDLIETEILEQAADGKLTKAIVRKTTRVIEQGLSWKVYKRDDYHCRYCGKDGIPMTVDHAVLWEKGGPSIEKNLITACRKCNKKRGNTEYEDWLSHPYYLQVSKNLTDEGRDMNERVVLTLDEIPIRVHTRSR